MIITRTPFRISFFGGGTDYPAYFRIAGGEVLSTSIDKYCYISIRRLPPFFEHKFRVSYSKIELTNSVDEIEHPSVRNVLKWKNIDAGTEILHIGDLPARSGIGSSSSFTVGFLYALNAQQGHSIDKKQLAAEAIHIEQHLIQEPVGAQDQIAAAYGGLNHIEFKTDGSFNVSPVCLQPNVLQRLESSLLLFFTGVTRLSHEYSSAKIKNIPHRATALSHMRKLVGEALQILQRQDGDIDDFGRLLHENWQLKKTLSDKVTAPHLEEIYNTAMVAGALGGKLMGAGGGGFFVFYVPKEKQESVKQALSGLVHVPFQFDNDGSSIVVNKSEGMYG